MNAHAPPLAALAELTHRCPLQCPYCSNPLELERAKSELDTETWLRVIDELAELGALQIHFSGGEPTVRKDLEALVARSRESGLYSNLITSGVLLDERRIDSLVEAGLDHAQLSFQAGNTEDGDRIGAFKGGHEKKIAVAGMLRRAGLPLTLNLVMHRQNLGQLEDMLAMAVDLDAHRVEVAHVQYYGWALRNRGALMPTRAALEEATRIVDAARERLKGVLVIDYVVPDYYARRPKACMGGWAQRFLNINPLGKVLPCHAAETITGLTFETVADKSLREIWEHSEAFLAYRGTDWMPEPCRSCDRREIDWGGCRCQAFALTGNAAATDPACALSPDHDQIVAMAEEDAASDETDFTYRNFANSADGESGGGAVATPVQTRST